MMDNGKLEMAYGTAFADVRALRPHLEGLRAVEAAVRAEVQVEVTTAEELDALPNDAVILDSMGDVGVVHGEYVWYPESNPIRRWKVGANYLPARVLYSPAALGGGTNG